MWRGDIAAEAPIAHTGSYATMTFPTLPTETSAKPTRNCSLTNAKCSPLAERAASPTQRIGVILAASVAARALALGVLSNTIVKLCIALVIGRGSFRVLAAIGLALMAVALGAFVIWW